MYLKRWPCLRQLLAAAGGLCVKPSEQEKNHLPQLWYFSGGVGATLAPHCPHHIPHVADWCCRGRRKERCSPVSLSSFQVLWTVSGSSGFTVACDAAQVSKHKVCPGWSFIQLVSHFNPELAREMQRSFVPFPLYCNCETQPEDLELICPQRHLKVFMMIKKCVFIAELALEWGAFRTWLSHH